MVLLTGFLHFYTAIDELVISNLRQIVRSHALKTIDGQSKYNGIILEDVLIQRGTSIRPYSIVAP